MNDVSPADDLKRVLEAFKAIPEQSLAKYDALRQDGRLMVGVYCIYAPSELIRAMGGVPAGLCGKRQDPIEAAERDLPPGLCPLIKSSYGYAITDTCPFFRQSDVLVAESTCDGKKKMYELMGELKPMHVMQLPHTQNGDWAPRYWRNSLIELEEFLGSHGLHQPAPGVLEQEIRQHNLMRRTVERVLGLAADPRIPLDGLELLAIQESKNFTVDIAEYVALLQELEQCLMAYLKQPGLEPQTGPRLMLTGVPLGKGSEKVVRVATELGARVVCMENCTGSKGQSLLVDETMEPRRALAERYLRIPCSCMSPNPGRRSALSEMGREYGVHGVIDLTWMGCHTYDAEATQVGRWVEQDLEVPSLHLATDYSLSDTEQLRTRIEAYLELITP